MNNNTEPKLSPEILRIIEEQYSAGTQKGYDDGYVAGHDKGYRAGYRDGLTDGYESHDHHCLTGHERR